MKTKTRQEIIAAPSGYELNPEKGWFGVIVPSAKTNYITNPSMELGTPPTGYTLVGAGAAIARSATYQRRGIYSLRLTPAAGVASSVYWSITLTAGTKYSWSLDFRGAVGDRYQFTIELAAGFVVRKTMAVQGDGHWHRYCLSHVPLTTAAHVLRVMKMASASVIPCYTDGWQLEEGNQTTYLDGDMKGFVLGQNDYRWNGTAHASTSWRSGQTRHGGEVMDFKMLGLAVMAFVGLGMAPVENISTELAKGSEFYQDTIYNAREFSILGVLESADLTDVHQTKAALIRAFTPDATVEKQPIVIRYTPYDCDTQIGEVVNIECSYTGGLEGNVDNLIQEKVGLTFKQYLPLIRVDGENAIQLGYQTPIANASPILQRNDDTGVWTSIDTNWQSTIEGIKRFSNGDLLFYGKFTTVNGVTYNRIARWNGVVLSAYVVGGNIGTNGSILDAVILPNDDFIVVGAFALAGGVVNTSRIARWDTALATWVSYGTGLTGGAQTGYGVAVDSNGYPIVTGNFTTANGVACLNIARWTGATFAPYGAGLDLAGYTVMITKAGILWVGGIFNTANGVTVKYITYWNGTTFVALSSGGTVGLFESVFAPSVEYIIELNNGNIVIGGLFEGTGATGVVSSGLIVWNGTEFVARFGSGALADPANSRIIHNMYYNSSNNELYISGEWLSFSGLTPALNILKIINPTSEYPTLLPLDISSNVAAALRYSFAVFEDPITNQITVALAWAGLGTTVYYPTSIANSTGESYSYPKIFITGPGTIWNLVNNTTKRGLYFSGLTLAIGETVSINFDPTNTYLISSSRGDVSGYLLPGSSLDFFLQPGANYITFFMYGGTTAATSAYMIWSDNFLSIDGTVW